jgi:hypothetical protein
MVGWMGYSLNTRQFQRQQTAYCNKMAQLSKIDSITECANNVMWLKIMVITMTISLFTEVKTCVFQRF